jgi:hypothetical protein
MSSMGSRREEMELKSSISLNVVPYCRRYVDISSKNNIGKFLNLVLSIKQKESKKSIYFLEKCYIVNDSCYEYNFAIKFLLRTVKRAK